MPGCSSHAGALSPALLPLCHTNTRPARPAPKHLSPQAGPRRGHLSQAAWAPCLLGMGWLGRDTKKPSLSPKVLTELLKFMEFSHVLPGLRELFVDRRPLPCLGQPGTETMASVSTQAAGSPAVCLGVAAAGWRRQDSPVRTGASPAPRRASLRPGTLSLQPPVDARLALGYPMEREPGRKPRGLHSVVCATPQHFCKARRIRCIQGHMCTRMCVLAGYWNGMFKGIHGLR